MNTGNLHYDGYMPRNEAKPLSRDLAMRAYKVKARLASHMEAERPLKLDYTKRDGTRSSSTGLIHGFSGTDGMDTMSVDILTEDKGIRTINIIRLHAFYRVPRKVVTIVPIADQTIPEDN